MRDKTNSPRVGVVILTWHNSVDTIECINSALGLDYPNREIIVVDNASADGSREVVRQWCGGRDVTFIASPSNLGYAGGNNQGIRHAMASCDYVWIINNDTAFGPRALAPMVEMAEGGADIVGSKLLMMSDPAIINAAGGGALSPWIGNATQSGAGQRDEGQWDAPRELEYVTGASMLVRRKVIEAIGLMDERYFLYWEDVDWCIRARRRGFKLMYCPKSVMLHKEGGTTGGVSAFADYYWVRNGLMITARYYPHFLPLVIPAYILKHTIVRLKQGLPMNLGAALEGMRDFFMGTTGRR